MPPYYYYYLSITILCWMTLAILGILVHENNRIPRRDKRLLYLTYLLVAASSLAELCGVWLDGRADVPDWALHLAKCADYTLTPMTAGALAEQLRFRNRWSRLMNGILILNAVMQVVSLPFGWMLVVDEQNHYSHGPLFPAYIGVCFIVLGLLILQFGIYGRSFRRRNRRSLYATMLLLVVAIALHEALPNNRTAYIGMAISAALMFIHYTEYSQLSADDTLAEQRVQLMLSQIKPHFLYNTLGSIEALCDSDPKAAKLATHQFSQYLRGNMNSLTAESMIPFENELQHARLYLELEQIRFGEDLRVEYQIGPKDFFLPPLTLEPIVENAVKHGIRQNDDGSGTVRISTAESEDCCKVQVADDGPGFDPQAVPDDGTHVGIRNVRERLSRICGGSLTIAQTPGRGTVVTILLPKKNGGGGTRADLRHR